MLIVALIRNYAGTSAVIGIAGTLAALSRLGPVEAVAFALAWVYLLPPLIFRVSFLVLFPQLKGDLTRYPSRSHLSSKAFLFWWFSAALQVPFMRFTALEEALRLFPSVYSFWLRLWGAKIGSNVTWAPGALVMDRPFISIGSRAVIGTRAVISAHMVNRNIDYTKSTLYLSPCMIGEGATIGLDGLVGPGARIADGTVLPAGMGMNGMNDGPVAPWKMD